MASGGRGLLGRRLAVDVLAVLWLVAVVAFAIYLIRL